MNLRENFGFYEGQNLILNFEKLLERHGIKIKEKSDLEAKFYSAFDVLFNFESRKGIDQDIDYRALFRDFSALYDLSLKVLEVEAHKSFDQLIPHLEQLNKCSIAQNAKSKITDQTANKIIELYIASLCMRFCDGVTLDHPHNSKGDNPDVIAEINGENWGFACKTIHTKSSQTIYENLQKAIDQIEKSKSITGIPVINLKNIVNHEEIWPNGFTFFNKCGLASCLFEEVDSIRKTLLNNIGSENLKALYVGKKAVPGILFITQSVSSVLMPETMLPTATRINIMNLFRIDEGVFTHQKTSVFEQLNHYMQLAN